MQLQVFPFCVVNVADELNSLAMSYLLHRSDGLVSCWWFHIFQVISPYSGRKLMESRVTLHAYTFQNKSSSDQQKNFPKMWCCRENVLFFHVVGLLCASITFVLNCTTVETISKKKLEFKCVWEKVKNQISSETKCGYPVILEAYFHFDLRMLQEKLDQPISSPPSPRDMNSSDIAVHLSQNINTLRKEVNNLRNQLVAAQAERKFDQ